MQGSEDPETWIDDVVDQVQRAFVVRAFLELELPSHLAAARTVPDLASRLGADADALRRLLTATTALGLTEVSPEFDYKLSPLGGSLRSDSPGGQSKWVWLFTSPWMLLPWSRLADSVRSGTASFPLVHESGFWEYVGDHPQDAGTVFDSAMSSGAQARAMDLLAAVDLQQTRTIVDVGGGQGLLLAALLRQLPTASGTVLDRPEVVASTEFEAEVERRITRTAGDFFTGVPANAEVYVLSRIIHDWPDDRALSILRACRAAMGHEARLCLLEEVASPAESLTAQEQVWRSMKDLNMLVLVGGKERTEQDYRRLLHDAGFLLARSHRGEVCDVLVASPQ